MFINSVVFMVDFSCLIGFSHGLSLWKLDVCHMCMAVLMGAITDDILTPLGGVCVHVCNETEGVTEKASVCFKQVVQCVQWY